MSKSEIRANFNKIVKTKLPEQFGKRGPTQLLAYLQYKRTVVRGRVVRDLDNVVGAINERIMRSLVSDV